MSVRLRNGLSFFVMGGIIFVLPSVIPNEFWLFVSMACLLIAAVVLAYRWTIEERCPEEPEVSVPLPKGAPDMHTSDHAKRVILLLAITACGVLLLPRVSHEFWFLWISRGFLMVILMCIGIPWAVRAGQTMHK